MHDQSIQNCNSICSPLLPSSPSFHCSKDVSETEKETCRILEQTEVRGSCSSIEGGAYFLQLVYRIESEAAKQFIECLSLQVIKGTDRKNKPGKPFKAALAALIANLLSIEASETPAYGYHGMSPEAFRLLPVGYRPYTDVITGMEAFGYLHREKGYKEHTGRHAKSVATKIKATSKLLALAADYGIVPAEWFRHFHRLPRPKAVPKPIVLKSESTWTGKGKRMRIDRHDPTVIALAKPINELNEFFHSQIIEPDCHYGFERTFANGDRRDYKWNQGARLYSIGGSYQHMPQAERKNIRLNGSATVELDIKASHLTILHALANVEVPNYPDPYTITGVDRAAVKTLVTMTLGYTKFHQDWTEVAHASYAKAKSKAGLAPAALPPFLIVKAAVLEAIPLLKGWPESRIRWGDLQFIESEAVIEAVHTLAMLYGVPALPVHDSIIVPKSQRALAENVLSAAFEKHAGVRPFVEAKG